MVIHHNKYKNKKVISVNTLLYNNYKKILYNIYLMYSNNSINFLLKSKNVKHEINKSIMENSESKLNNLTKNIDKLKRKVLHMDLEEDLSNIKNTIDILHTNIKIVNDEIKNGVKYNEQINLQLREMKLNMDMHYKNTLGLTHSDLEKVSREITEIKNDLYYKINNNEAGNYFSKEFITTISSGNYTKPSDINFDFTVLDGTNIQQINVYKIGYYSSVHTSSHPIKLYGTLLIPSKVTKEEVISYKTDIIYQLQSTNFIWKALDKDGIWFKSNIQDRSEIKNENLLKINCLLSLASLGYIILIPDGFSSSDTTRLFTYEGETLPSVDMIRSIRKLILSEPELFNGFKLIDQTIKLIQLGYSTGGIYGPSVINEFTCNSPNISSNESNKISFVAGHFGGVPSIETIVKNMFILGSNKNKGYYRLPLSMLILIALYFGNCPIIEQIAQPSAYGNFFQLFKGKWFNDWDKFNKQIFINLFHNHELNVRSGFHNNKDDTTEPYIKPSDTMFDIRQIINIKQFVAYKEYFMSQSGWTNILRPLENIRNIPISNLYSETDELVLLKLQEMNKSFVIIDCSQFLDKYMGKGETFFDGPNKKIIVSSESNDNDYANETIKQYDVTNKENYIDIIDDIKFMNDSEYRRYILKTNKLDKELYGHNNFTFIWFDILYNVLA